MAAVEVCDVQELAPGEALAVVVTGPTGDVPIAVIRDTMGDLYAIDEFCTHGDVSLVEGDIGECEIECWAHSAIFNLKNGEGTLPAVTRIKTYPVTVKADKVFVDVEFEVKAVTRN